ncbi:surface protein-like [Procambarus clarkii]|uniref:surface protein-like n=1 Tax=Procambarus clarkii TaxID=6728 RepID=UPI003744469E
MLRTLLLGLLLCLPEPMLCRPTDTTNMETREETQAVDTTNMETREETQAVDTTNMETRKETKAVDTTNTETREETKAVDTTNTEIRKETKAVDTTNTETRKETQAVDTSNTETREETKAVDTTNTETREETKAVDTTNTETREETKAVDTTNTEIRKETQAVDTSNTETREETKAANSIRSPKKYRSRRQATDIPNENDIPSETRNKFVPPTPRTKEARDRFYFSNYRPEIPPHAYVLVKNEPFFGTVDHAKLILALEQRRKLQSLPLHLLRACARSSRFSAQTKIIIVNLINRIRLVLHGEFSHHINIQIVIIFVCWEEMLTSATSSSFIFKTCKTDVKVVD